MLFLDNSGAFEYQDTHLKTEAVNFLTEMARQASHATLTKVLDTFTELDKQYHLVRLM